MASVALRLPPVILAAGRSSRMGVPKQLLRLDGATMLDHVIRAAVDSGLGTPVLVLGANYKRIMLETALADRCEVVRNQRYAQGQSTSMIAGIRRIMGRCDGALFLLGDQPFITPELLGELAAAFSARRPDILYPTFEGRRGNPAIIASRLFPALLKATGDAGARGLFKEPQWRVLAHPVRCRSVLDDIDTPEEYRETPGSEPLD